MINDEKQYPCACCGFLTLSSPEGDSYEICPVCYWEDDKVQNNNINFSGGANAMSLREARLNYSEYGAIDIKYKSHVRNPLPTEKPNAE